MKNKVYEILVGFLIFAAGGALNYFGSNPRILYLPAIALCLWVNWIILAGVHTYVSKQAQNPKPDFEQSPSSAVEPKKAEPSTPSNPPLTVPHDDPVRTPVDKTKSEKPSQQSVIINNTNQSGGSNAGIENK